jgi:hypothetical protein
MTVIEGALPYDLANLLGGACRVLYADTDQAIPAKIHDVIELVHPYDAKAGWTDLGATGDASSYSRNIDSEGYEIQQATGAVLESITDIVRQFKIDIAEIKPEHIQITEEATTIGTVAAVDGTNTQQKVVKVGNFSEVTQRRFAFVSQRQRAQGIVTEPSTLRERGQFVLFSAYRAQIAAEESEVTWDKGNLATVPCDFRLFPEPGEDQGEETAVWVFEAEGLIDTPKGVFRPEHLVA